MAPKNLRLPCNRSNINRSLSSTFKVRNVSIPSFYTRVNSLRLFNGYTYPGECPLQSVAASSCHYHDWSCPCESLLQVIHLAIPCDETHFNGGAWTAHARSHVRSLLFASLSTSWLKVSHVTSFLLILSIYFLVSGDSQCLFARHNFNMMQGFVVNSRLWLTCLATRPFY